MEQNSIFIEFENVEPIWNVSPEIEPPLYTQLLISFFVKTLSPTFIRVSNLRFSAFGLMSNI